MNGERASTSIAALGAADIAHAGRDECATLLGHVKQTRGWLDAVEARVTSRMTELYETDDAEPAADMHTRCGGVSAAEGRRKERRSKTLDEAPSFGESLADGRIGAEHVDALANATSKLDDDVRDEVFDLAADLLADAEAMSPEQFGRSCRDLARHLERDHGLERNRRQRRDTFLSRKLDPSTGMVEGRFAFHPELANNALDAGRSIRSVMHASPPSGSHRRSGRRARSCPGPCHHASVRKYVIMGVQGSGKGTQARRLASEFELEHIEVGDIFRWNVQHHTKLGAQVRRDIGNGELVGDDVVEQVVRDRLEMHDWNYGFVIDGFPRTVRQASFFLERYDIDAVIHLVMPDAEVEARVNARRVCAQCGLDYNLMTHRPDEEGRCDVCGGDLVARDDDHPEALAQRLRDYHERTEPAIALFAAKEQLVEVDATRSKDDVYSAICAGLGLVNG